MAQKLTDVAPVKPLFETHEKVKKEDIVGQELVIIAYAELSSDDGDYGVIAFRNNDKLQSCTMNTSMLDRIKQASDKIGLNEARSTPKEKYLADPISATIKSEETKKGRTFYSFE